MPFAPRAALYAALVALGSSSVSACSAPSDSPSEGPSEAPETTKIRLVEAVQRPANEIGSSVLLVGDWDSRPDGKGQRRCVDMVDRAARLGSSMVSFVPTHYVRAHERRDGQGKPIYDPYGAKTWEADEYCFMWGANASGKDECRPFDVTQAAPYGEQWRIKDDWKACIEAAVRAGMDISIVPHLDDARQSGVWRNNVFFDPLTYLGASGRERSYKAIMLDPLAHALVEAVEETGRRNLKVLFALQGEMGATVMGSPWSWKAIADELRVQLEPALRGYGMQLEVGVSLNFNKVGGGVEPGPSEGLRQLFGAIDFVGLSSYGYMDVPPEAKNFDRTVSNFAAELQSYGIDLRDFVRRGKTLHFSELGIGGGNASNRAAASSVDELAMLPFAGVFGPYTKARDPWQRADFREYRRRFYDSAREVMSRGRGSVGSGQWEIRHAFLWNLDSWDVQGVYPSSTSSEGSYRDADVVCDLFRYNTGRSDCP